jgi:hypothetical protein
LGFDGFFRPLSHDPDETLITYKNGNSYLSGNKGRDTYEDSSDDGHATPTAR